MSNIHNEQLFTELTPAEGANVTGGATYCICSKNKYDVTYTINGKKDRVRPGEERCYSFKKAPKVTLDSKIGPGYKPKTYSLKPGCNCFEHKGGDLILTTCEREPGPGPIVR